MPKPRRAMVASVLLAAILILTVVIRVLPDSAPDADVAVIDIHVLNVLRELQPVGAYSRFGWSHPGPMYFQLLAPMYFLGGYHHISVPITAAILNALCLIAMLVILARYARGPGVTIVAAALLGVYVVRTWGLIASSWTAHVPILPLALLVVCGAAAVAGSVRWLPAVVALATLVVQAHVGLALCAGVIVAASVLLVAAQRPLWPRLKGPLLASLAIGVVLWALPVIDAVRPSGSHNLQQLYAFFTSQKSIAASAADRTFAHYFVAPFSSDLSLPWGDAAPLSATPSMFTVWRIQLGLLFIAAVVWAVRRQKFEASLAVVTLLAAAGAWASVRRLPPPAINHTVYWVSSLGVVAWAAALALPLDLLRRPRPAADPDRSPLLPSVLRLSVACVSVIAIWQVAQVHRQFETVTRRNLALTQAVRARLDEAGTRTPLVQITQDLWQQTAGVILQLARTDIRPTVSADWVSMFGTAYQPTGHEPVTLRFASFDEHAEDLQFHSNYRLLGSADRVYAYAVEPVPPATVAAGVQLVDRSRDLSQSAPHLLDGAGVIADDNPLPPTAVTFRTAEDFVTVQMPDGAAGVRLWGQSAGIWQLRCSPDGREFASMGRVTLPAGPGTVSGESFLKGLKDCRHLRLAPSTATPALWLSEVQVLKGSGLEF